MKIDRSDSSSLLPTHVPPAQDITTAAPATSRAPNASHLSITSRRASATSTTSVPQTSMPDRRRLPQALLLKDVEELTKASPKKISEYLDEAAPLLRKLSQNPQAPMTPSAKQALANLAGAVFSNIFGFGVPTVVSAAVPEKWQGLAYGATLAATSLVSADTTSLITRKLGGANPSVLIGGRDSAVSGPYTKIGGDTLTTVGNLATYGAINALESGKLTTSWDSVAKSVSSGASMALLMQGLLYYFAKKTLDKQQVSEAEKLPEIDHNRSLPSGVYLKQIPKWSDRTNSEIKTQEMIAGAISSTFGAAAAGTIKHFAPTAHPALQSFVTIFGGVGAYFAATQLGKLAYTYAVDHPGKFANRHGIAASDVAVQHIAKSAMNEFEGLLDRVGDDVGKGKWGPDSKKSFENAYETFLGRAFRNDHEDTLPHIDAAKEFKEHIDALATQPEGDAQASHVPASTVKKMQSMLRNASNSIQVAIEAAEHNEPTGMAMQDVRNRIRDVQSLLLQSQYQLGGPEEVIGDTHVMEVATKLAPAFAALRQFDRLSSANSFVDKMIDFHTADVKTTTPEEKQAARRQIDDLVTPFLASGRRSLYVKDVVSRLAGRSESIEQGKNVLHMMVQDMADVAASGEHPTRAGSKLMILANMLAKPGQISRPASPEDREAMQAAFKRLGEGLDSPRFDNEADRILAQFKDGSLTANALHDELERVSELPDDDGPRMPGGLEMTTRSNADDLEAGLSSREYRQAVERFRSKVGGDFIAALEEEVTPSRAEVAADGEAEKQVSGMIRSMWNDAANMPDAHRELMSAAMSLHIHIPEIPVYLTHDAHFHPTSYSGRVNSLSHLIDFMNINGVERTNLAGIPSQQRNPRPDRKYYANSEEDIYYRDHDKPLIDQYRALPDEDKKRFDLSMTGFDVTDGNTIGDEMDSRMRSDPGAYSAVGEVTWKKEIVSSKNPRSPNLDSRAAMQLLEGAAQRGLPLILHCDRGTPEDKNAYAQSVMSNIRGAVKKLKLHDILAQKGILDAPPIKPKIVWAHGAGISRFTAESTSHTKNLDDLLSDESLKDVLSLDLSWDFIGHDIMENVHDSLKRRGLAPDLCNGLQNLLRAYKAFSEEGGRADKCDDMGDLNLASAHRVAGENIRQTYLLAIQDFKHRIGEALNDKETRDALFDLMDKPGEGNNWLHLFNKHQDRLLFGTDALAVGIKAHGDAAYAMNVRVLNPLYMLIDELAEHPATDATRKEKYQPITKKITLDNYVSVFSDEGVMRRRSFYEQYLITEKKADHSTNLTPDISAFSPGEVRGGAYRGAQSVGDMSGLRNRQVRTGDAS